VQSSKGVYLGKTETAPSLLAACVHGPTDREHHHGLAACVVPKTSQHMHYYASITTYTGLFHTSRSASALVIKQLAFSKKKKKKKIKKSKEHPMP